MAYAPLINHWWNVTLYVTPRGLTTTAFPLESGAAQIDVDPVKLRAYNIPVRTVFEAVESSNSNVGAKVLEVNDREFVVRGLGLIKSVADIESIVLENVNGTPVYVCLFSEEKYADQLTLYVKHV